MDGGIPILREDWRWDDQEKTVPSTCSSLVKIISTGDTRVVQFSHFSVKQYLTSPRLARSRGDLSRFCVNLQPAHTIMSQVCLATLLRLHEHAGSSGAEGFPLAEYATQHWLEHAQFEDVSLRIRDGIYDLFDNSKPHFAAWRQAQHYQHDQEHDRDEDRPGFTRRPRRLNHGGFPLYYAAFFGFYDLAEHLIMEHPEQVNAGGDRILAPLPAALFESHFHVANLLHRHGAFVDVRGPCTMTPLHTASMYGRFYIMRWLLVRGADANARKGDRWAPLHLAAHNMHPEAVQMLLKHGADVNSRNDEDNTPLFEALFYPGTSLEGQVVVDTLQRLLEHGANPNIRDRSQSTPLHRASSKGWVEVARLLLSFGANVDEKDEEGRTPFHVASSKGHHETTNLLLEHGAVP